MLANWIIPVTAFFLLLAACAGTAPHRSMTYHHYEISTQVLASSNIPLHLNDRVAAWVDYFAGPGRKAFAAALKRSGLYAPMIRRIMNEYGIPDDILYLALIESGFSPTARSEANAVGIWQFIQSTGARYGLTQDLRGDDRQDPEKSTRAAAQYLRDLYNEFQDWHLALAAYNSGEGTVRQAITRYQSRNYWALSAPGTSAFLPETQDYVPKYIAATLIAKNPDQFGFGELQLAAPISPRKMSLVAARRTVDAPRFPKILPPLALDAPRVSMRNAAMPTPLPSKVVSYTIKPGDTLMSIIRKNDIDHSVLRRLAAAQKNGLKPGDVLSFRVDS